MNIVLFGDSHLGRFGKNAIDQLESLVEGSSVYNCSAGGFTSIDGANHADFIGTLQPEIAVFSYGGNDVAPWKDIISKEIYLQNMHKIYEAFTNSAKILFTSADVTITDPIQAHEYNASLHGYRDALVEINNQFNVSVVDGNEVVAPMGKDCHVEDGVHMNDEAYVKVIEALARTINSFSLR